MHQSSNRTNPQLSTVEYVLCLLFPVMLGFCTLIHISGVKKCVTKFMTLSKTLLCDSVKNFVTHFVTAEIWTLRLIGHLWQKMKI